jgi:hypothetical protein
VNGIQQITERERDREIRSAKQCEHEGENERGDKNNERKGVK